jgi:hypothetical protein
MTLPLTTPLSGACAAPNIVTDTRIANADRTMGVRHSTMPDAQQ